MHACRNLDDAKARLACFDAAIVKLNAPTFEGRLGLTTEPFQISGPTQLRYQSDGVIFVLYLKDEHGNVLQNLHIGGGGEGTYIIASRGTYALQINGSESWRVWIEPIPKNSEVTQPDNKD